MNNQIRSALITAGLAGMFCGVLLRAQGANSETATVPFSFQAAGRNMPAGEYRASESGTSGLIQMQNQATGKSIFVGAFVSNSGKEGQSKLTFRCYDGSCFLAEIWFADESSGHAVARSAREREMAAAHVTEKLTYIAMR